MQNTTIAATKRAEEKQTTSAIELVDFKKISINPSAKEVLE